ncbi:mitochondrial import inner membrane [Cryptosporidium sp. chipmunk genotype I]|uniref:mitochondrial import inner membrane n=1 Tax=Cryptosporidium sp. chipmunk genotype I TaxID=1280935 RepID=UPI00351AA7BA|nr:mitochondrial import inner membrane [Cryptosporidium sp. chipmunk genotype I]
MEVFSNYALKKICVNGFRYNFARETSTCRNISLFYRSNEYYMHFTRLSDLNLIKRRFYVPINSYYNQFILKLKNEIKNDKLLQDDIKLLKRKFDDLYFKFQNNLRLRSFYFSNNSLNITKLYEINKFLYHVKFLTAKISSIFSRLLADNFFSKHLKIIKNVLDDETNRIKIEKELSNWKSDRIEENTIGKINVSDKKIRNLNIEGETEVPGIEYSVIIHNYSLRDRFCIKLKDMPLLRNLFENKYIETIFSGNEISRAVKEMKTINPKFKLNDFISIFEVYILPKFIESYLKCDEHKLRLHCGDAIFRQLYSNIIELKKMGLSLNTKILQLGDIELRGAKSSELIFSFKDSKIQRSQPTFIFTFKTQQINCLQDSDGRVISGSLEDIKELQYSIAVTPHPNIN